MNDFSAEDIERLAANNMLMPEGLSFPQQMFFVTMRGIYKDLKSGMITKDQAKKEKLSVLAEFTKQNTQRVVSEKIFIEWQSNIKQSEELRHKLRKGINAGESIDTMFYTACTCIAAMTGDATLSGSDVKAQIEKFKLSEVSNV